MRRPAWAAVLAAAVLAGCGVQPQDRPEPVPRERLPSAAPAPSGAEPVVRGRVWGAREQRLVPVVVDLTGTGTADRVRAVLRLREVDPVLPTVLVPGTELRAVRRDEDLVELVLSDDLAGVPPRELPLALGQLVLTVTEDPAVRRVLVVADDEPVVLVDGSGRPVARPLVRGDFLELVRGG